MTTYIYTVYKTTNLINNKIYIGVHKTTNPTDSYLGSGNVIKLAISKYGKNNFNKEILFEYNDKDDAYMKEKQIVNAEFISRIDTYNQCIGGCGGQTMIGNTHWNYKKHHSIETRLKIGLSCKGHKSYNRDKIWRYNKSKENTGKNNPQYNGEFITPWGVFDSANGKGFISNSTVNIWCKNHNKIINNRMVSKSPYLKSLNESPIGKSFSDIGFFFNGLDKK